MQATTRSEHQIDLKVRHPVVRTSNTGREVRQFLTSLAYLSPSLLLFGLFVFYPLVKSIDLSAHLTDQLGRSSIYVGLEQYSDLFKDQEFLNGFLVSFRFALIVVPATLILGMILALLAHTRLRGIGIYRTIFAVTLSVSAAIAATIFAFMFNPITGVLNYLLGLIGISPIQWLVQPASALPSVALVTIWTTIGFNFVILLSGLQGVPEELYESARIDGANNLVLFRHITIPMISPTLLFLVVTSTLGALQAFAQVNILTRGGPAGATDLVVYQIYREAFINYQFGSASAQAMLLFVVMMVITIFQFTVLESRVYYR